MSRSVLSPAARTDLERIWDYTVDRWGGERTEEYVHEIQRAIELVSSPPMIGRARDEVRSGYRKHSAGSHVLYCRATPDGDINVVRILHHRTDVDRHFS